MGFVFFFFLLMIGLSYAELMLLVNVAAKTGFLTTAALCLLTAVVGGSLVRAEGLSVLSELQTKMARGEDPSKAMVGGVLLFVSGILLLVPGFITDAFGFLCLLKPFRESVGGILLSRLAKNIRFGGFPSSGQGFPGGFSRRENHGSQDGVQYHTYEESGPGFSKKTIVINTARSQSSESNFDKHLRENEKNSQDKIARNTSKQEVIDVDYTDKTKD